ncbi:MAG: glycosyltransferase [Cyclobacteriaceae bacterium]|nr:glycosyltransferase [Cyclobacteriaceae bacterium]
MRFFFIIQGEGRGHMTQAITLSQLLREDGHEVVQVVIGMSPQRQIPDFFYSSIKAPVVALQSPNFVTDKNHKSVSPIKTVIHALLKSPVYLKSLRHLARLIDEKQPDIILNFYDFIGGIYHALYRPKARFVAIAHQYLLEHPQFTFAKGRRIDKWLLLLGNRVTRLGADGILALSFRYLPDVPHKKLYVVPPLLREGIRSLIPSNSGHLLAYVVNPGYGEAILSFHKKYPEIALHCFWDQKNKPETWEAGANLTFHSLNDTLFLEKMASCQGYVTTAGFESVCEAMYLGKPVMMVPVEGHYEQACNAVDAEKAGAGIAHDQFDLRVLTNFIPSYRDNSVTFKHWADSSKKIILSYLTRRDGHHFKKENPV